MASKPPSDLLYDSEATLRQIDSALDLLCDPEPAGPGLRDALQRSFDPASLPVAGMSQDSLQHLFAAQAGTPVGLLGLSREWRVAQPSSGQARPGGVETRLPRR